MLTVSMSHLRRIVTAKSRNTVCRSGQGVWDSGPLPVLPCRDERRSSLLNTPMG